MIISKTNVIKSLEQKQYEDLYTKRKDKPQFHSNANGIIVDNFLIF